MVKISSYRRCKYARTPLKKLKCSRLENLMRIAKSESRFLNNMVRKKQKGIINYFFNLIEWRMLIMTLKGFVS